MSGSDPERGFSWYDVLGVLPGAWAEKVQRTYDDKMSLLRPDEEVLVSIMVLMDWLGQHPARGTGFRCRTCAGCSTPYAWRWRAGWVFKSGRSG